MHIEIYGMHHAHGTAILTCTYASVTHTYIGTYVISDARTPYPIQIK